MASSSTGGSNKWSELSKALKPIIWVLVSHYNRGDEIISCSWTGFSIHTSGFILTSCSGSDRYTDLSKVKVFARRLDTEHFYATETVYYLLKWDLLLLKVKDVVGECQVGEFASSGSLSVGESLFCLANYADFVGSLRIGEVAYACTDNFILPSPEDSESCGDHDSDTYAIAPRYRRTGDIWNKHTCASFKINDFRRYLHPSIPVIQCNGFTFSPSCSGSPVFNTRGKIVGMLVSEEAQHSVSIHVKLLKFFLNAALG